MLSCLSRVWLFVTLWTVAHQAPLSMGFSSKNIQVSMSSSRGPSGSRNILMSPGSPCRQILYCWATWWSPTWCSVQFSSVPQSCPTLCDPMNHSTEASLSITSSQSLAKPMSIESVMPSNHLILCHPLLLLTSNFPSIRVFSNESALRIKWPKYWSFSFTELIGIQSFKWIPRTDLL